MECTKCLDTSVDPFDYYDGKVIMTKCEGKCYFDGKQKSDEGWYIEKSLDIEALVKDLRTEQKDLKQELTWQLFNPASPNSLHSNDLDKLSEQVINIDRVVTNIAMHRYC